MPIQDITETISPEQELHSVGNCINVCYEDVTILDEKGIIAFLTIPQSIYDEIQDGSTMTINGVTYTFVDGAAITIENLYANIIPLAAQPTLQALTGIAIGNNFKLPKDMSVVTVGFDTTLTMRRCGEELNVTFTGLSGPLEVQTLTSTGTPLSLQDDFRIATCYENAITKDVIGEVNTYPFYTLTDDKCNVESIETCKDVSELLSCVLEKHLPDLENQFLRPLENTAIYWSTVYGERYGSPLNTYGRGLSRFVRKAINGAWQNGEAGSFEQYAATNPIYQLITSYDEGSTVCIKQPLFFYADSHISTDSMLIAFDLRDANGNQVIAGVPPFLNGNNTGFTIEANVTPCVVIQWFEDTFGIDGCNVRSMTVATSQLSGTALVSRSEPFEILLDCCDCCETFVFCSTLGVYETISTKCLNGTSMTVAREFIELCEPCLPGTTARGRKGIATTAYKDFQVFHWDESDPKYNDAIVCELMQSKDVYWVRDGQLYAIEVLTNETDLVGNQFGSNDKVFNFRLMGIRN